jgi:hypothetical protein
MNTKQILKPSTDYNSYYNSYFIKIQKLNQELLYNIKKKLPELEKVSDNNAFLKLKTNSRKN